MKQRTKTYWLAGLLGVLVLVLLYDSRGGASLATGLLADDKFEPLSVADPVLRIARLDEIHVTVYPGVRRNIFSAEPPPAPRPKPSPTPPQPIIAQPTGPAPLDLPFKFFGYAADTRSGKRRAFFTNGDEVYIASEGETILTRFRVLRIGNTTSDLEEISTGRRATLSLDLPAGSQPPQG